MKRYNPKDIESKWQKAWEDQGTYKVDLKSDKPKYYGFAMFNYPSGASIHLGHAKNFTIPDVLMRFKRQQGYEAYSPVGFDSFGLPAENYAIKTGQSPRQTTDESIEFYRKQYRALGWSMDWSKEIDTSKVDYYKWTQWCFNQLHKEGLAYQKESPQWWCDQCKTVLADEQVFAGKCWRHESADDPVISKRSLRQWFFKITDYADEILDATDALDWTPWVKTAQKNWIGRSEGAEIKWQICDANGNDTGQSVSTFTTRKDTIPGVTFIVVAPESSLLDGLTTDGQRQQVQDYKKEVLRLGDIERMANKDKSGVALGSYAKNPINDAIVPLHVASYVLGGYGTGVVMGMGGHDLRDREFSFVHSLPIIRTTQVPEDYADDTVAKVWSEPGVQVNSGPEFDGLPSREAGDNIFKLLVDRGQAESKVNYKVRDWLISRQRYWGCPIPIIHCQTDCGAVAVPDDQLPVELPVISDYHPSGDGQSPLAKVTDWVNTECPTCGGAGKRETDTMDGYVCSSWYQMRYLDPHNDKQAWDPKQLKDWMPVNFYNGGDHATAHLLYARFFTRFFYKQGLLPDPEPFKKMYFHAKILAADGTFFSKSKGNGVDPLKIINSGYGADALRAYIMFIAPPDVESPWNEEGVPGVYRFLNRVWVLCQEFIENAAGEESTDADKALLSATHQAIKKVTADIEDIKLNTAIAAQMKLVNELYKIKDKHGYSSSQWKSCLESLLMILAPFAPHMTEELWQQLGNEGSIHVGHWPVLNESHLVTDSIKLAVQINGKVRAEIEVAKDASKEDIESMALSQENVQNHLDGKEPTKVIYVPGRLVSIVVR